jgi:hypothetical protein
MVPTWKITYEAMNATPDRNVIVNSSATIRSALRALAGSCGITPGTPFGFPMGSLSTIGASAGGVPMTRVGTRLWGCSFCSVMPASVASLR